MPFSYTNFQKLSLPWDGDTPLTHPPPLRLNSGYATGLYMYYEH